MYGTQAGTGYTLRSSVLRQSIQRHRFSTFQHALFCPVPIFRTLTNLSLFSVCGRRFYLLTSYLCSIHKRALEDRHCRTNEPQFSASSSLLQRQCNNHARCIFAVFLRARPVIAATAGFFFFLPKRGLLTAAVSSP